MRFFFLVPICTERNANATSDLAMALRSLGHDVHIFTREVTRVRLNGVSKLSRNQAFVDALQTRLGNGAVSRLHSNLSTRELGCEQFLTEADGKSMLAFAQVYRPDAVVRCDDALAMGGPMIAAGESLANGAIMLAIQLGIDRQQWVLRHGEKAARLPFGNNQELLELLRNDLLKDMDPKRSQSRLREALKQGGERLVTLECLEVGGACSAPQLTPGNAVEGSSISREVVGELESVKSGDVIFGRNLWLKGWVDFGDSGLKSVVIRVNDSVHECMPNTVRGELAERMKNPNIHGFDTEIPLEGEGAQLHVRMSMRYKDGRERDWRSLSLWANDSVPVRYRSPVLTGEAHFRQNGDQCRIDGQLDAEGYEVNGIKAVQCGRELALWVNRIVKTVTSVKFGIDLPREIDPERPVHLWVDLGSDGWVHWTRCQQSIATPTSMFMRLAGITEGQVARGSDLTISVALSHPNERVVAHINGVAVAQALGSDDSAHSELTVPLGQTGNDMLVELTRDDGSYATCRLWRHLEEPLARTHRTVVSVPDGSTIQPVSEGRVVGKRKVLLIRKSPAPTDELYVLAPLRPLVQQGLLEVTTIDLDSAVLRSDAMDDVLQPDTVVIVSRYISDLWVQALTARKSLLGAVFYLMDDDVLAAEDTRWLPADYRARMAKVGHGEFQTMVNLCDRFVVTSEFLAHRYRSGKTRLLEPPYLQPPRDMRHFEKGPLLVAYHGTLAHRDDVAMIAPALRHIHDRHADIRMQTVMGTHVPDYLKGLRRVEIVRAMPWDKYKEFSETARAHIAIAPVLRTPYNLGKSIIKIHDIASLGAVGVYSRCAPYTKYISEGQDGLLVENDSLMWQKALGWLVEDPERMRNMAVAGQVLAQRIGAVSKLTDFWTAEMGIDH